MYLGVLNRWYCKLVRSSDSLKRKAFSFHWYSLGQGHYNVCVHIFSSLERKTSLLRALVTSRQGMMSSVKQILEGMKRKTFCMFSDEISGGCYSERVGRGGNEGKVRFHVTWTFMVRLCAMTCTSNPRILEVEREVGICRIWGQSGLHREFIASVWVT